MLLIFKWTDNFPIFNPTFTRKFPSLYHFTLERLRRYPTTATTTHLTTWLNNIGFF